jgi:hypothetical protein
MRQLLQKVRPVPAAMLLAAAPLLAHLHTKPIGFVAGHARELVGKSFWVDGCVNSDVSGNLFQLQDGTGAISVQSAGEAPPPGTCMELNGVVRFHKTAGRYVLEERSRKIR